MEPPDLYRSRMPSRFAEGMPRTEFADGQMVTYIDGKTITRRIPGGANLEMMEAMRAQGASSISVTRPPLRLGLR